jgi:hypothetical protein
LADTGVAAALLPGEVMGMGVPDLAEVPGLPVGWC